MTIDEAVVSLTKHLGEPDVFIVRKVNEIIVVDVNFIYRVKEVPTSWEGFVVTTGRRSCW